MVNFDINTADAVQVMNEIMRISITEYKAMGVTRRKLASTWTNDFPPATLRAMCNSSDEEADELVPTKLTPQEVQMLLDEMLERHFANEKLLDSYFDRLKELLKETPPGRKLLKLKQRQVEILIKKNEPN